MQIELQIETANSDDAEAILTLQRLAYRSEAKLYHDDSLPPLLEHSKRFMPRFVAV